MPDAARKQEQWPVHCALYTICTYALHTVQSLHSEGQSWFQPIWYIPFTLRSGAKRNIPPMTVSSMDYNFI